MGGAHLTWTIFFIHAVSIHFCIVLAFFLIWVHKVHFRYTFMIIFVVMQVYIVKVFGVWLWYCDRLQSLAGCGSVYMSRWVLMWWECPLSVFNLNHVFGVASWVWRNWTASRNHKNDTDAALFILNRAIVCSHCCLIWQHNIYISRFFLRSHSLEASGKFF